MLPKYARFLQPILLGWKTFLQFFSPSLHKILFGDIHFSKKKTLKDEKLPTQINRDNVQLPYVAIRIRFKYSDWMPAATQSVPYLAFAEVSYDPQYLWQYSH